MDFIIQWFLDRTPHQLDVIRTMSNVFVGGGTTLLGFLFVWGIKILRRIRRDAEAANSNTRREEHVNGKLHTVSIAEDMKRTMYNTEDLTQLLTDPPRVHGRRRNTPTNQIPRQSLYESGEPNE